MLGTGISLLHLQLHFFLQLRLIPRLHGPLLKTLRCLARHFLFYCKTLNMPTIKNHKFLYVLPLIAKMMYIQLPFISLPIPQHDNNDDSGHGDGSRPF